MLVVNVLADRGQKLEPADREALDAAAAERSRTVFKHCADYVPTPLFGLPALARNLGVAGIDVKDESARLGLGSFKALGGAYAVIRLALEAAEAALGRPVTLSELDDPAVRAATSKLVVASATDGNHGRSVAWGASLVKCRAVIFLHAGVSAEREAAIARFGAEIVRVDGNYDDSVAASEKACADHGWTLVSDTSWPGYERIPTLVMEGYTAMGAEVVDQLSEPPTHCFLQAGVGGLAAAMAGYLSLAYGEKAPRFVIVEPERAACLLASHEAGRPVKIDAEEPTVMAMLECYEPSLVAWRILSRVAHAFMTVDEASAPAVMNRLGRPIGTDPAIVSGESGGAGLAALIAALADPKAREQLGLDAESRVLLFNTEGATDRDLYTRLTQLDPDRVVASRRAAAPV